MRLRRGDAALSAEALRALHARNGWSIAPKRSSSDGIAVSVDLAGASDRETASSAIAPSATPAVIEVERRAAYDVGDFWEPIAARADGTLILDPDEFYILASKEAVQVPPDYAAEMVPFDPLVGEFRVHYAGFFDPGFGYAGAGGWVRGQCSKFARAKCRSSSNTARSSGGWFTRKCWRPPDQLYGSGIGSNYQAQGLKLSKHFR